MIEIFKIWKTKLWNSWKILIDFKKKYLNNCWEIIRENFNLIRVEMWIIKLFNYIHRVENKEKMETKNIDFFPNLSIFSHYPVFSESCERVKCQPTWIAGLPTYFGRYFWITYYYLNNNFRKHQTLWLNNSYLIFSRMFNSLSIIPILTHFWFTQISLTFFRVFSLSWIISEIFVRANFSSVSIRTL